MVERCSMVSWAPWRSGSTVGSGSQWAPQAQVVIAFRAVGIELYPAAQDLDGFVDLIEAIVDRPKVNVRSGPQRIEPGHFLEMVGSTRQIVNQKTDGCQPIVNIRGIGLHAQRAHLELAGLLLFALSHSLTGLTAQ